MAQVDEPAIPRQAAGPEAERALWDLAVDAAGVGTFDLDLATGALRWDDRLISIFGYAREEFGGTLEDFNARVHPDDLPRVLASLQAAVDACGTYEAEYRVVVPDGMRWVQARGRVLCGEDGAPVRVVGAAYETTAVREGEARTARVLESMSAAFYALDRSWRFTYVNAEAERLLGRPREELLGGDIWELFPAAVGSDFDTNYRHAMETGETVTFTAYYPAPLNGWYELRVWPSPDGLAVYFLDISTQVAALDRAALLTRATTELTDTLDPQVAVARLAEMLVPEVCSWCIVTLVDEDVDPSNWRNQLHDVGWAHHDPALEPTLAQYAGRRLAAFTDETPLLTGLFGGGERLVLATPVEQVVAALPDEEMKDLLRALHPRVAVVQPMRARGHTRGLLTLCWDDRDEVRTDDLDTITELAGRAGLALDNARLYDQARRLAEGLQRSLLTAPPEPNHMQVVVRYVPAAATAEVGGDWYDAFLQRDGATVLVIGDVVGHDVTAAAAMGQIRGLLRGIAATTGEGPAAVLTRLDDAMELLAVGTTATAAVARFEQSLEERDAGLTRITWSSAGHPPPFLVGPDGAVRVLDGGTGDDGADLLLGFDPTTPRQEFEMSVLRPCTVLLYTDGLVEQRGQTLEDGLEKLRTTLGELSTADLTLDELCDELLRRMLPARSQDDVAITAVRLHPLERPRPPEAGPQVVPPGVPAPPS